MTTNDFGLNAAAWNALRASIGKLDSTEGPAESETGFDPLGKHWGKAHRNGLARLFARMARQAIQSHPKGRGVLFPGAWSRGDEALASYQEVRSYALRALCVWRLGLQDRRRILEYARSALRGRALAVELARASQDLAPSFERRLCLAYALDQHGERREALVQIAQGLQRSGCERERSVAWDAAGSFFLSAGDPGRALIASRAAVQCDGEGSVALLAWLMAAALVGDGRDLALAAHRLADQGQTMQAELHWFRTMRAERYRGFTLPGGPLRGLSKPVQSMLWDLFHG